MQFNAEGTLIAEFWKNAVTDKKTISVNVTVGLNPRMRESIVRD